MKKSSKSIYIVLLAVFLCTSLTGCEALLDNALDCIDKDGPEFTQKSLPNPVLNQTYDEFIEAYLNNEPYDNDFDYTFTVHGELPTGITTEAQGRKLHFRGAATALGTYEFTLEVDVEDPQHPEEDWATGTASGLCYTSQEQVLSVTVLEL